MTDRGQSASDVREKGAHFSYRGDEAWQWLSYLILVAPPVRGLENLDRQRNEVFDMGTRERAEEVWRGFVRSSLDQAGC